MWAHIVNTTKEVLKLKNTILQRDNLVEALKLTAKQFWKFFLIGILAFLTDGSVYFTLINYGHVQHDISKATSFFTATIIAFLLNKFWTFQSRRKSLYEVLTVYALYAITFTANTSVNHATLSAYEGRTVLAFLLASTCSTMLNFLGMKFIVFRGSGSPGE